MRTRVGIELTPVASRIVEVVDRGRVWRSQGGESVVRAFGVCPALDVDGDEALACLRGKAAAVIVWGTASEHRQVEVSIGSYENMRAEALRALADDGVPTRGVWADIAPAGPADGARMRVVVSAASAKQMADALQPLTDAGIRVRTAMTPAAALAAIARSRRAYSVPDTTEAYVALDSTATCVALIRNGALMAAHELAWGFLEEAGHNRQRRRRDDIAAHLGDDLADLFTTYRDGGQVTQMCICGGLPELRTTTLPLMERFDIEVEILDSLSGIDVRRLQPADEFRERVSELRMAWVAAADWTTINLLRPDRRRASHALLSRAAVVAGVAAGLGSGWSIARSDSWTVAAAAPSAPMRPTVSVVPAPAPPLPREVSPMTAVAEALAVAVETAPPAAQDPPTIMQEPVAPRHEPARIDEVPRRGLAQAPTPIQTEPPPLIRHEPQTVVRRVARPAAPGSAQASTTRTSAPGDPLPFEAALSSILFSPDRQLAIIDGRVVGRGDAVRDATVIEISAGAVLLRDSQGRLRRLSAGGVGR